MLVRHLLAGLLVVGPFTTTTFSGGIKYLLNSPGCNVVSRPTLLPSHLLIYTWRPHGCRNSVGTGPKGTCLKPNLASQCCLVLVPLFDTAKACLSPCPPDKPPPFLLGVHRSAKPPHAYGGTTTASCWGTTDMSHHNNTSDTTLTIRAADSCNILGPRIERKRRHLLVTTMWSVTSSPGVVIPTHSDTHIIAVI